MKRVYRYGSEVNSHDLVKVLAISAMVVDHVGFYFLDDNIWFRIVGRMAAPLFFFLVGYSGSYRFKSQLVYFGVFLVVINYITNSSDNIIDHILPLNILLCFVAVKWLLGRVDVARWGTSGLVVLLCTLAVLAIPTSILVEYGAAGLSYAIGARLLQQKHPFAKAWISVAVFADFVMELLLLLVWNEHLDMNPKLFALAVVFLFIVYLTVLALLIRHDFRTFGVRAALVRVPTMYVSRYSLEIYVIHLSAFRLITWY